MIALIVSGISHYDVAVQLNQLAIALSLEPAVVTEDSHRFEALDATMSCRWILNNSDFKTWYNNGRDEPSLLFISGAFGTGKSVLASYLAIWLRQQHDDSACQIHFFSRSDHVKRSISYLLKSFAYQIAEGVDAFRADLLQMNESTPLKDMTPLILWGRVFIGTLFRKRYIKSILYWIIDGMDEAETGVVAALFQCLKRLEPDTKLRILLLGHDDPEIEGRSLQSCPPLQCAIYRISPSDTEEDIKTYIHENLAPTVPPHVLSGYSLVQQVLSRAEGNFLWVKLVTNELKSQGWISRSTIEQTLNRFHVEMTELYAKMLEKVKSQNVYDRSLAITFLMWATYSFRPLTIAELQTAIQSEFDELTSLQDTVGRLCGGLVKSCRTRESKLSLVHGTARAYLMSEPEDFVELRSTMVHENMAINCLQYLSFAREHLRWRQTLEGMERRRAHPLGFQHWNTQQLTTFLHYAAKYWAHHLSLADPSSSKLMNAVMGFFDQDVLIWINMLSLISDFQSVMLAAQYLRGYINNVEKDDHVRESQFGLHENLQNLKIWCVDFIKLVGNFGSNLAQKPSAIYRLVPPFCPKNSMLSKKQMAPSLGGLQVISPQILIGMTARLDCILVKMHPPR
jgi:hypothetical protein